MSVNVRFFASRSISWYMARSFVLRTLAVLAGLVLVLLTLDLLGESGQILAHPGNGDPELWRYASLRAPQIVARFLPFSVLLATLITLVTMNQNSEIIAMKAAGISAHQILAPLVVASFGIAIVSFTFNERIVTRATATLDAWQEAGYGPIPDKKGIVGNVWVLDGDDLIHVNAVGGRGSGARLGHTTVYVRDGGVLRTILDAPRGEPVGNAWRLDGVRRFDVGSGTEQQIPSVTIGRGVTPDRFTLADVQGDQLSFEALRQAIGDLKAAGRPTGPLEAAMWHKISGPLSSVLMPLLAGVAAFGLARSGRLFLRAVTGMALGFAYFVADNFGLAMGNLGAYPPLLAAWGPFFLFLMIGETVLIRTEE